MEIVSATKRPWREVEETWTSDRIRAARRYWKSFPPEHVMIQAIAVWLGAHKPEPLLDQTKPCSGLDTLKALFPGGINSTHLH